MTAVEVVSLTAQLVESEHDRYTVTAVFKVAAESRTEALASMAVILLAQVDEL